MTTLFLNIASHEALVALVDEATVVSYQAVTGLVSDERLIELVEALNCYNKIKQVACVVGPGGFTSLRVGVTFANVLSDQLKIPQASVHLAALYKARLVSASRVLWIHSTKRNEVFGCDYSQNYPEPIHLTLDKLTTNLREYDQWCGELIPEHQALITDHGLQAAELASVTDVLPEFLGSPTYKQQILEPWYGRGG